MCDLNVIDITKELIIRNKPVEQKLHVIAVVSNPCNFKIRYKLASEFIKRMEKEPNVILYVVELVYDDQKFAITSALNKRHLQLKGHNPLWHKENMINLGIKYLLPSDWKAVAWIDADVEFDNPHWALDTLKILNGPKAYVQLFTHCIDMDVNKQIMSTFTSFAYQYSKNFKKSSGMNYWHPGFAWACNREAYNSTNGICEKGILGSGDNIISHCFIKKVAEYLPPGMSQGYKDYVLDFQEKISGTKLYYITGSIRHFFHGKKQNRNYHGRNDILKKYQYNPNTFLTYDNVGLIIPSENCPKEFLDDIMNYFQSRNEDEMLDNEIILQKNNKEELECKKFYLK